MWFALKFLVLVGAVDLSMHKPYTKLVAQPETKFDTVARLVFSLGAGEEDQSSKLISRIAIFAVLFMVLPAVNLVNMNLSRIMERASEIGIRKAFGASSLALIGQFVVENVLLTLVGGVLALGLAYVILHVIAEVGWVPYARFHLNLRIFGYALLVTVFFGFLSGVYPAWKMSRMKVVDALKGGA